MRTLKLPFQILLQEIVSKKLMKLTFKEWLDRLGRKLTGKFCPPRSYVLIADFVMIGAPGQLLPGMMFNTEDGFMWIAEKVEDKIVPARLIARTLGVREDWQPLAFSSIHITGSGYFVDEVEVDKPKPAGKGVGRG